MMVFVRPNAMLYQEAEVGELFQRPYFIVQFFLHCSTQMRE